MTVEFSCKEDRDYYMKDDPAHKDVIKVVGPVVADILVMAFEDGDY